VTTTAKEVKQEAVRGARSVSMQRIARAGLVAQGISFGIVAVIAFRVAVNGDGELEDRPGALQSLASETVGRFLLGALALGLAGYALWRFAQTFLGEKLETGEDVNAFKRIGYTARGLLYGWLAFICTSLVVNADEPAAGSGKGQEDRATSWVLEQPLGRWLVAAVGLGICGVGLFNLYRALTQRFRKDLKEQQMGRQERRWYTGIGVAGHLSRALVFSLAGFFLVKAAYQYDPKEAIGLDGALRKVADASYGPVLLWGVAVGLFAYGLFCFVQARYREV
jgi:Domain of Unknown Function (DUF1206)